MVATKKSEKNKLLDLIEIERERASRGLRYFVNDAWHELEAIDQPLVWNWTMDAICDHLEAVTAGEIHNLLINVPPGFSKSVLTNVYWPAWEWIKKPQLKYLSFAYDQRLSLRDNRRCRNLIRRDWYTKRWGDIVRLTKDQASKDNYVNTRGGWRQASTIGGAYGTGERANRLIIDDPHSVKTSLSEAKRDEALTFRRETLPSRMINPGRDAKICIMQRLHVQDFSGDELSEDHGDPDVVHLMIPMRFDSSRRCFTVVKPRNPIKITEQMKEEVERRNLKEQEKDDGSRKQIIDLSIMYAQDPRTEDGELAFEERFSEREVVKLEKSLGAYGTAGQLGQEPRPRTGALFDRAFVEVIPAMPSGIKRIVRSWDLAGTKQTAKVDPAATASVKMAEMEDGSYVVMHALELYELPPTVAATIRNMASQDGKEVTVGLPKDPAQAGKYQFMMLTRSLAGYKVKRVEESGDKDVRAEPFADQWKVGNVKVLKGPWNEMYFSRMENAGAGKKDIMDASSGGFFVLTNYGKSSTSLTKGW